MTAYIEFGLKGGGRTYIDARTIVRIDTSDDMGPSDTASAAKPLKIHLKGGQIVEGHSTSVVRILLALQGHGMIGGITCLNEDEWMNP